ncbi:MarR family transcriptional regulator [Alteribacillus iranensis]|uniref:DNA-binding transcriptional regulator, MarR family n=1 Tax=Alteribacillus iranensis TaxID=930128 RepID=A0A1I2DGL5_9BACI|nr:MarR family transcriptional regulator [Alteribacillus iranensis]SFE79511.1 DNA-binding transcriptional regulator, MarR family [Alteribacillus iranensis]
MALHEYRKLFLESIYSIENISTYLQPRIPLLSELQLTIRQESIMLLYIRHEDMNLSGMAEKLGISKSAVSQAMRNLEKEDLLHRSINENNRREITLSLGENGKILKQQFEDFEDEILEKYISNLDLDEMKQVRNILLKLEEMIRNDEERDHK